MALFNIPQFIDKEDKVVGPFTAKQLGYMFGAGAALFVLWTVLKGAAFYAVGLLVVLLFGALGFYRPNGQTFSFFLSSVIAFFLHPKVYIWKRMPEENLIKKAVPKKNASGKKSNQKDGQKVAPKIISDEKISEISRLLANSVKK